MLYSIKKILLCGNIIEIYAAQHPTRRENFIATPAPIL
jgi:hypothetical protein